MNLFLALLLYRGLNDTSCFVPSIPTIARRNQRPTTDDDRGEVHVTRSVDGKRGREAEDDGEGGEVDACCGADEETGMVGETKEWS
jgi:hypothetical protein